MQYPASPTTTGSNDPAIRATHQLPRRRNRHRDQIRAALDRFDVHGLHPEDGIATRTKIKSGGCINAPRSVRHVEVLENRSGSLVAPDPPGPRPLPTTHRAETHTPHQNGEEPTDLRRWRAKVSEQGTKSSRSCCEALLSRCKLAVHLAPFRPPGVVDRGPRRSIGGVSLLTTVDSSLPRWSRAVGCKRLAAARPTSSASNRALTCNDARALQRKYIRAQGTKPNDPTQVQAMDRDYDSPPTSARDTHRGPFRIDYL